MMPGKIQHGHTRVGWKSPTYVAWDNMIGRCTRRESDPTCVYWKDVSVCDRWLKFKNFLADMGVKPEGMTLDRIDSSEGYAPNNCRWASRTVQSRNAKDKSNNTSGHTGVSKHKNGRWRAYISVASKQINLGSFRTKEEAVEARKKGEKEYWCDLFEDLEHELNK